VGHAHELTFSCYRALQLLSKDRTRQWVVEALHAARRRHQLELCAYVIMPEHMHVLMLPRGRSEIEGILKTIKLSVSKKAVAYLRENSPDWLERNLRAEDRARGSVYHFWQPGGGYDRNITNAATAWACIDYIHKNPVKRGLAACETDWLWSSARWYAGMNGAVLEMDARPPDSEGVFASEDTGKRVRVPARGSSALRVLATGKRVRVPVPPPTLGRQSLEELPHGVVEGVWLLDV